MRDPSRNVIVSLADFFTSSHTSMMISKYLFTIKALMLKCISPAMRAKIFPSYIVTDHSFALINSVLATFNNCTLLEYLNYTFHLIFDKKRAGSTNQIKMHICSVHFLKIIISKVNEEKVSRDTRNFFIFCFTILQNATRIEVFERNLLHIYNVFMQPKLTQSCLVSINIIKSELKNRDMFTKIDLNPNQTTEDSQAFRKFKYVDFTKNSVQTIKKQSPFTLYFNRLLISYSKIVASYIDGCGTCEIANPLFQPRLMNIITSRLWHISMWTGILVHIEINQTRLSNNNVECYFKIFKNHWVKDQKSKLMPSEVACMLNKKNKATYKQFYEPFDAAGANEKYTNLDFTEETWKKNKKKRSKGFYYKDINDETIKMNDDQIVNNYNELTEVFGNF